MSSPYASTDLHLTFFGGFDTSPDAPCLGSSIGGVEDLDPPGRRLRKPAEIIEVAPPGGAVDGAGVVDSGRDSQLDTSRSRGDSVRGGGGASRSIFQASEYRKKKGRREEEG